MKVYVKVYLSLLVLLGLTVLVSVTPMNAGVSSLLSLAIAAVKGGLILVFFMKLNIASPKIRFFAFGALVWSVALITLISVDYLTRGSIGTLGK